MTQAVGRASVARPTRASWLPADIDVLISCGLRVADHPNHEELITRYFGDRGDGLKPWGARVVTATVP